MNAPSQTITEYMAEAHRKAQEAAVKLATAVAAGESIPNDRLAKAITEANMDAASFESLVAAMRERNRIRSEIGELDRLVKRRNEVAAQEAKLDRSFQEAERKYRSAVDPLVAEREHLDRLIGFRSGHRWKLIHDCPIDSLRLAFVEADRRKNALRDGIREREEKIQYLDQQLDLAREVASRGSVTVKPDVEYLAKVHANDVRRLENEIDRMRRELAQAEIDTERSAEAAFRA